MSDTSEELIFAAALERATPADRVAYLDAACAGDAALRALVDGLLASHDSAGNFLESPLAAWADTVLDDVPAVAAVLPELRARAAAAAASEGSGSVVGPYTLREPLGEGGMGVVYRAEQVNPVRREVALKIIKPGMDSRQVIARFEAERQALALMDHPNIAKVLDAGVTAAGRPYFVMELVRGVAITAYCDERGLPLDQRLALFVAVCHAVQHAHQKGVIHRDLKPSNVLVAEHDGRPVPKVIDFGVAKAVEQRLTERTMFTAVGAIVGTPEYMSPEQAETAGVAGGGADAGVDTRSDVYSLGVLLYELLTGTTPLEARRLREAGWARVAQVIRDDDPPRPSTRLSGSGERGPISHRRGTDPARLARLLAGDLDWVVMRALEKDRGRRYATVNALARDVERYLTDEPVEARPPSAAYRVRKFARRHRGPLAAAAGFALLLAGGTAVSTWQAVRATRAEAAARADRDRALAAEASAVRNERAARDAEQTARADRDRAVQAEAAAGRARDDAVAQQQRADREAAVARAALNFLDQDVLGQANPVIQARPDGRVNRDMTVREALDRASETVGKKFRDQPGVEVRVRNTLGKTYNELGEHEKARAHLEAAAALADRALGPDNPNTLATWNNLATLYIVTGDYAGAERYLLKVIDGDRAAAGRGGPDDPALAAHTSGDGNRLAPLGNLAGLYRRTGRLAQALPLYRRVHAACRAAHGPDDVRTITALNNLGLAYQDLGQPADALPLFEEAVRTSAATVGDHSPLTLTAMHNLGRAYDDLGRPGEAEPLLRQVADGRRAALGEHHRDTLNATSSLAGVLRTTGRPDEAEPLYEQVYAVARARLGPSHPLALQFASNLAGLYRDLGRPADAEPIAAAALAAARERYGAASTPALAAADQLAATWQRLGRRDDGAALLADVLAGRRETLGDAHPDTVRSMVNAARALKACGRAAEAEPLLREVAERQRAAAGAGSAAAVEAEVEVAAAAAWLGRAAEAEGELARVVEAAAGPSGLGASHPAVVDAARRRDGLRAAAAARSAAAAATAEFGPASRTALAARQAAVVALREAGAFDDAGREAAAVRAARAALGDPAGAADARYHLGLVLAARGDRDAARAALRDAFEEARAATGDASDLTRRCATEVLRYASVAVALDPDLLDPCVRALGASDPESARPLVDLGGNLVAAGKYAEAEPVLRAAADVLSRSWPDGWPVFQARSLLGRSLVGQGRYAEAEPLLLAGHDGLRARAGEIPEPLRRHVRDAVRRLVALYDAWERPDEAAAWRARLHALSPPATPVTRPSSVASDRPA